MENVRVRIPVVIATWNSGATLEACLQSLLAQTAQFEIIVIDGAPQDYTLEILARHRDRIGQVRSEPDGGLYDALNKGVSFASGKYVYVLGSDDQLADPHALAQLLRAGDADAIYGDVYLKQTGGKVAPWDRLATFAFSRPDAVQPSGGPGAARPAAATPVRQFNRRGLPASVSALP